MQTSFVIDDTTLDRLLNHHCGTRRGRSRPRRVARHRDRPGRPTEPGPCSTRLTAMAVQFRGILAALAVTAVSLAALAGCSAGLASRGGSSGPAASTPATGATGPTASVLASPTGPTRPGATGTPIPAAGSGITGVTVVDGGCPVLRLDSPCPDRPLQARLIVTDAGSGTVVATADTDPAGHFRLLLRPGRYLVRAVNPNGAPLPRTAPVTTTVTSGQYTTLTIRFDSGIR